MKLAAFFLLFSLLILPPCSLAQNILSLPPPDKEGGKSLQQCLSLRRTERSFSNKDLPLQAISSLLWSAWGINREDGRRTVPTARNRQQVELYVALPDGVWRYDGAKHRLIGENRDDVRAKAGSGAAILFYAAPEGEWGAMHVGSMYQNVGLFCASTGLNNVVRAQGREALAGKVTLPPGYKILITQAVGLPR